MTVIAQINYVDRNAAAPATWYVKPSAGTPVDSVVIDAHDVPIMDLREHERALNPATLTTVNLQDGFRQFDDEGAIRRDLAPAMVEAVRALLGDCLSRVWHAASAVVARALRLYAAQHRASNDRTAG